MSIQLPSYQSTSQRGQLLYLTSLILQEIMLQKVMSHITAVKKDMIILEKSEFSALLAENEVRLCRMIYYHHPLYILYSVFNVIIHYRSKV